MANVKAGEFESMMPDFSEFKWARDSYWEKNPDEKPPQHRPAKDLYLALEKAAEKLDRDANLQIRYTNKRNVNVPRLNQNLEAYAKFRGSERYMHLFKSGDFFEVVWKKNEQAVAPYLITLVLRFQSAEEYQAESPLVESFVKLNKELSIKTYDVNAIDGVSCAIPFLIQDSSRHYSESLSTLIRKCLEVELISKQVFASIAIEEFKADDFKKKDFLTYQSYKVATRRLETLAEFREKFRPGNETGFITTGLEEIQLVLPDFVFDHVRSQNMELIDVHSDWRPIQTTDEQLKKAVDKIPDLVSGLHIADCPDGAEEDLWRHLLGHWARKRDRDSLVLFWECHESRKDELMFPIHECFRRLTGVGFGHDEESAFDSHSKRLYRWLCRHIKSSIIEYLHVLEIFLLRKSPVEASFIRKLGSFFTSLVLELARERKVVIVVSSIAHADDATLDLINSLRSEEDITIVGIKKQNEIHHKSLGDLTPIQIGSDLRKLLKKMTGHYQKVKLDPNEKLVLKMALLLEWNFLRSWIRKIWLELKRDAYADEEASKNALSQVINSLIHKKILRPSGQLKDYGANLVCRELRFFGKQSYEHFRGELVNNTEQGNKEDKELRAIIAKSLSLLKKYIEKNTCNAQNVRQKFQVVRFIERLDIEKLEGEEKSDFEAISKHLPAICNIVAERFMGYSPELIVDRLKLAIRETVANADPKPQAESLVLCLDNLPLGYQNRKHIFDCVGKFADALPDDNNECKYLRFRILRSLANWKLRRRDFAEAQSVKTDIENIAVDKKAPHLAQDLRQSVIYMQHMQKILQKQFRDCAKIEPVDAKASHKSAFYARSKILEALALFFKTRELDVETKTAAEEAKLMAKDDSTRHFVAAFHSLIFIAAGKFDLARERCYDEIIHTGQHNGQWELFSQQMFLTASLVGLESPYSKKKSEMKSTFDVEVIQDFGDIFESILDYSTAGQVIKAKLGNLIRRFQKISTIGLPFFFYIYDNRMADWRGWTIEKRLQKINELFGQDLTRVDDRALGLRAPKFRSDSKRSNTKKPQAAIA